MPKELIHFTIAEMTANSLKNTRFGEFLRDNRPDLLLGSIFHDTLFYARLPRKSPLESLAHALHGAQGEDTHNLIRIQAKRAQSRRHQPQAIATLVGLIAHIHADITMHPMIWHLTGDYYASEAIERSQAVIRHRRLESLIDMVFCPEKVRDPHYRIKNILKSCPHFVESNLPLAEIALMAGTTIETTRSHLKTALLLFSTLQGMLASHLLAWSFYETSSFLPRFIAEIGALFYSPQLLKQKKRLLGPIEYEHPVTGKLYAPSLQQMMDRAADNAAKACMNIEAYVFDKKGTVFPEVGPSLDTGLPETPTQNMHHFTSKPYPYSK